MLGKLFGHRAFPIVVLAALGYAAYANSLHAPFVFDDVFSVQHNQHVRFGEYFHYNPGLYLQFRSLLFFTFAVNEWIGGQNVLGYHAVNVMIHIVNSILVFVVGTRLFRKAFPSSPELPRTYALLAAAFFILHPVQTEAVTYVSSRSDLLSTTAYLCGLLVFMLIPESRIGVLAALAVLFFLILGFGFKETIATLPAGIFLYDYIFVAKSNLRSMWSRWRFYAAFAGLPTLIFYAMSRQRGFVRGFLHDFEVLKASSQMGSWNYLLTEFRVMPRYFRLIVFPTGLNLDYNFPIARSFGEPAVALSFLLILAVIGFAWRWREARPVFAFSIFWFFITLLPTSSIIPIPDVITERRLYLPLAGVCLSFPVLLATLGAAYDRRAAARSATARGQSANGRLPRRLASAVLALLLILTVARNYVWSDDVRLFSDAVAKSPHMLRPYQNLMLALMKRGEEEQAIVVAKAALQNIPQFSASMLDTIGNLYLRLGRPAVAIEYFKKSNDEAIRTTAPKEFIATSFNNLGVACLALAKTFDERNAESRNQALRRAREAFQKSLETENDTGVVNSLVDVVQQLGEAASLEAQLPKNLAENSEEFSSVYMLATLLSFEDRYSESLEYFRRAERPGSENKILHFNYAFALARTGQTNGAIEEYINALHIDPIFQEAHYNVALLYMEKRDYPSALQHLNAIVSTEAANVTANMKLAEIYAFQGKIPLARQHLQIVLKATPQDREALTLFAKIGG
jgi:protein O-mannosyl-transferase